MENVEKNIKYPMFAAVILQSIAVLITVVIYFMQAYVLKLFMHDIKVESRVLPDHLVFMVIILILYSATYSLILSYKGSSRREIGIVMTAFLIVINFVQSYFGYVLSVFYARRGAEYLAVKSSLNTVVAFSAFPFTFIAMVLAITAYARFGVKKNSEV